MFNSTNKPQYSVRQQAFNLWLAQLWVDTVSLEELSVIHGTKTFTHVLDRQIYLKVNLHCESKKCAPFISTVTLENVGRF